VPTEATISPATYTPEAPVSKVKLDASEGTATITKLPADITYDKDVPVKATSVKIDTDAVNVDGIGK
jgi:hypothetical protein